MAALDDRTHRRCVPITRGGDERRHVSRPLEATREKDGAGKEREESHFGLRSVSAVRKGHPSLILINLGASSSSVKYFVQESKPPHSFRSIRRISRRVGGGPRAWPFVAWDCRPNASPLGSVSADGKTSLSRDCSNLTSGKCRLDAAHS